MRRARTGRVLGRPHQRRVFQRGATLVELMVVTLIAAVLVTIAAPAVSGFVRGQRLAGVTQDLHAGLLLARSEAIKRRTGVSVQSMGIGWSEGWLIKTGEIVIRQQTVPSGVTVSLWPQSGNVITFRPDGRPDTGFRAFRIDTADAAGDARCILLDVSGTPRSRRISTEVACG